MVSPLSSVTSPQVLPDLWFQFLSTARSLMLYTTSLTLVFVLPGDCFWKHLSGLASPRMSPTGPEVVYTVNEVKFSNIFTPLFPRFLFLPDGSVTFTWTWLDLLLVLMVSLITSLSWTEPLVGMRLFLSQQPPGRGRHPTSALVSLPMVQDPGLNPVGDFLPQCAPSLRRSVRPLGPVLGPGLLFLVQFLLWVLS